MILKVVGLISWTILGVINIIAKRPTRFDYFFPWFVCMMLMIWSFFE